MTERNESASGQIHTNNSGQSSGIRRRRCQPLNRFLNPLLDCHFATRKRKGGRALSHAAPKGCELFGQFSSGSYSRPLPLVPVSVTGPYRTQVSS